MTFSYNFLINRKEKNLKVESYNINIDGIKKVPLIIIFSGLRSNLGFTYFHKLRKTQKCLLSLSPCPLRRKYKRLLFICFSFGKPIPFLETLIRTFIIPLIVSRPHLCHKEQCKFPKGNGKGFTFVFYFSLTIIAHTQNTKSILIAKKIQVKVIHKISKTKR